MVEIRNSLTVIFCKTFYSFSGNSYCVIASKNRKRIQLLFTFLDYGAEPANNAAEQALREHAVIRKIIGGLRSLKGANVHVDLAHKIQKKLQAPV